MSSVYFTLMEFLKVLTQQALRLRRTAEGLFSQTSVPAGPPPAPTQGSCTHCEGTALPGGVTQPLEQSFPMSWQLQTQVQEAWVCLQQAGQMYCFPKERLTNPCQAQQMAMLVNQGAKLREKKCIFPSNKYVLTVGLRENPGKHLFIL